MSAGAQTEIVQQAACDYITAGFAPIPLLPHSKAPSATDWPDLRVTAADVPALFTEDSNIGLLLGAHGNNLTDIDCDCIEAARLASRFVPITSFIGGRASAPQSHYFYTVDSPLAPVKFSFNGQCLVELRSSGQQTVVAPSLHPTGEQYEWHEAEGKPATVTGDTLSRAVAALAAAALLTRHYPKTGVRHDFSLALSGYLLRRDWPTEKVQHFVQAIAEVAGDSEIADRLTAVETTSERLALGDETVGGVRLREIIGDAVFSTFSNWLFSTPASVTSAETRFIEADAVPEETCPVWPAAALDGDYIGELAYLLTNGTGIPPQFARECCTLVLAAIADGRIGYPLHRDLPTRRFLALVSEFPQSGKGASWQRIAGSTPEGGSLLPLIRETLLGDGTKELRILNGNGIGSGQYLAKELEENPHAIIVWDELTALLKVSDQQCSTLFSALKSLFEGNECFSGSYTNKKHGTANAHASILMQATVSTFQQGFALRSAVGDGLLSRFVLAYSPGRSPLPEWEPRDLPAERAVVQTIRGMIPRTHTVPEIADDARERMREYVLAMPKPEHPDFIFIPRLFELTKIDALHRCVYSGSDTITLAMVERSIAWADNQLALRRHLWTPDAKNEVAAATQTLLRRLQKGRATKNDLRRAAHVDRTGKFEEFNRALSALTNSGQARVVGKNKKQQPVYGLAPENEGENAE